MAEPSEYRLAPTARPERYELELAPDLQRATFEGRETVTLSVLEPIRELVLNAIDLRVDDARLVDSSGRTFTGTVAYDEPRQRMAVSFAEQLQPADGYRLHLSFNGVLNERLQGFYRSTFTDEDGTERVIASTQFEATDARRAFPCWDEPEYKAVFSVTLIAPEGLAALSNGAETGRDTLADGRSKIRFADTIPMSTYLVAFVVGPFEISNEQDVDGVPLRVAAVPGKSHLTGFSAGAGSHALRFLASYFDIPYPSDKIDHVAIPDFSFGAMENLGCVTYRESALLTDPDRASQLELQRVATVVAHETAHMWFGDLVTMKWWDGIWLNEAFATFMELLTTDHFMPEWDVWTGFSVERAAAMVTDGLRATRPIEFPVGHPEEAEAMFDLLTYQKGGAVLRMLEHYLGAETFRKGIGHYLRTHSYGNTETADLWEALETVSGEPVQEMMSSWIRQGGHPIITGEETAPSAEGRTSITLRQRRFLYSGGDGEGRWVVPVNLRASVDGQIQRQRVLLDGLETAVSFDGPVDWVVLNDGAWGFYRVHYSSELWRRMTQGGLLDSCNPLERFQLLSDSWAATIAGTTDLPHWAEVVRATAKDDDPDIWAAVSGMLAFLRVIAADDDLPSLRSFASELAGGVWSRLGWEPRSGEAPRTATARARVLAVLGLIGENPGLRAEAAERYERHLTDRDGLAPDVVSAVARIVVATGGPDGWESALQRYLETPNPQEKLRYLYALTESPRPELISRTLDLSLTADVRSQDAPFLIAGVLSNPHGSRLAWEWLREHWEEVASRLPSSLLLHVLQALPSLADAELAESVHRFCSEHEIPVAKLRLDQILERLDINAALADRLRHSFAGALQGRG